ncbi:MAG: DNA/RNA nuclease SfsA [Candidatus Hydrogenedens sp.]|jgi:sugar fermentation stimulation protein A|nr:DNA/RNA nuclease SfsA [Candidatus Hydrogenedens sp.]
MTAYTLPHFDTPLIHARFIERPNRFLLRCADDSGREYLAFLPNPGRLTELMLPDVPVYLIKRPPSATERATDYTAIAVDRDGSPVMLHTHLCNDMAEILLRKKKVPGLEKAEVIRREVKYGRSRFDFLLEDKKGEIYLEVKSCTLFGNGIAMFPDAVTERGTRHLLELAHLADEGDFRCSVLFVVQTDTVRYFMPDYHTDPVFSETMLKTRESLDYIPLPVSWNRDLSFLPGKAPLEIPWDYVEKENQDRGAYLLVLELKKDCRITIGALGEISFKAGYYLYAGSALGKLSARVARHKRPLKRFHWHIDYLRQKAKVVDAFPIRSSEDIECLLAQDLRKLYEQPVLAFGSSDCSCPTHLFRSDRYPVHETAFHALVQRWRMRPPK